MIVVNGVKYYDTFELSEMLKVTRMTLFKYRKNGRLRHVKVGDKYYTSEQALNEFLTEK